MRIAVTGTDERFIILRRLLEADGHQLVSPDRAEVIVPPPWDSAARYARSESYRIANAALTAEGAAALLARELPLPGAEALVLGFGRVGSLCARALERAGCSVTVAARRRESRVRAEAEGYAAADTVDLAPALGRSDVIVNTVPEPILTGALLRILREGTVLLELASPPGGVDAAAARELGLRYIRAPGLPGTYAPERAAAILRDAVYETAAAPLPRLGVAVTGSHCTFARALEAFAALKRDYELIPILSAAAAGTDTRFGTAAEFRAKLEALSGRQAADSIAAAEICATAALDALLVAPCTGNTLGKLAGGVTDTAVTMACKAHLRNGRPLVLAISTNDGLSGSAGSIAALLQRKNVYFVPFHQDAPQQKPFSLQAEFDLLGETVASALAGRQLQPMLV